MTTCPRSRSHKLRCSATPLAHDYRQQRRHTGEDPRTEALQDLYNAPTVVSEVRGGRRHRTRLYGPGYQPCPPAKPYTGFGGPASGNGYPLTWLDAGNVSQHTGLRCREGLPTYPYIPCCP